MLELHPSRPRYTLQRKGLEVVDRGVDVDWLDRIAGEEVNRVEHLAQPDQVLKVGTVADPAATIEVTSLGETSNRSNVRRNRSIHQR